ncbi:hypothetical protein LCGC14_1854010, partial [marine sediment metagenome]
MGEPAVEMYPSLAELITGMALPDSL